MKDVNKRFQKFRITNPEEIKGKFIKSVCWRMSSLYISFDDDTFLVVKSGDEDGMHYELDVNFSLSYYDYKNLGLITEEEVKKYSEASIQSQNDSNKAWELKELKRLKEKYEGE